MFNWLSVIILLPLELITGYLELATDKMLANYGVGNSSATKLKLLTVLTEPLTDLIIQIDKNVIKDTAINASGNANGTGAGRVLKIWCKDENADKIVTTAASFMADADDVGYAEAVIIIIMKGGF